MYWTSTEILGRKKKKKNITHGLIFYRCKGLTKARALKPTYGKEALH
jgi:hypothetical protein